MRSLMQQRVRARRPRRLLVALLGLLLSSGAVQPLQAQGLPYYDSKMWLERVINSIAYAANWMTTTRTWSEQVRAMTNESSIQAEIQRRVRRKAEDKAIGELGRLGDRVTNRRERDDISNRGQDQFGLAQVCGVAVTGGGAVCADALNLRQRYENILRRSETEFRYEDPDWLADGRMGVQGKMYELLGPSLKAGLEQARPRIGGPRTQRRDNVQGVDSSTLRLDRTVVFQERGDLIDPEGARRIEAAVLQGTQSSILGESADSLEALLTKLEGSELAGTISSARARQIEMLLLWLETRAELELTRAQIASLESAVMGFGADLRAMRLSTFVGARSIR